MRYYSEPSPELRGEARLLRVFTETELFDAEWSSIDRAIIDRLAELDAQAGCDLRAYEELREVLAAVGGRGVWVRLTPIPRPSELLRGRLRRETQ